jgi:hypothetical protein
MYSEELDLDGSDTSSQRSTEAGEPEEIDLEEGRGGKYGDERRGPRAKSQQSGSGQRSASGNKEQDDTEHIVNKEEGRMWTSEEKDFLEANLEVELTHPRLRHHDIDCLLAPGNS